MQRSPNYFLVFRLTRDERGRGRKVMMREEKEEEESGGLGRHALFRELTSG